MNLTRSAWRYIACANMNFLRQGFRKLSSDRHTDRQTRPTLYTTPLRGWSISGSGNGNRKWHRTGSKNPFLSADLYDRYSRTVTKGKCRVIGPPIRLRKINMQTRGNSNTTLSTEYAAQSDLRFTMLEIVSKEHSHKCSPRLRDTPMIGGIGLLQ